MDGYPPSPRKLRCQKKSTANRRELDGGFKYFLMFIPTWGNDPIWLIFFRWVVQPTTRELLLPAIWLKPIDFFNKHLSYRFNMADSSGRKSNKISTWPQPSKSTDFCCLIFLYTRSTLPKFHMGHRHKKDGVSKLGKSPSLRPPNCRWSMLQHWVTGTTYWMVHKSG